jgi:hypothetical protein
MTLEDAKGGPVIIDAFSGTFTGVQGLIFATAGGHGVEFLTTGGIALGPTNILIGIATAYAVKGNAGTVNSVVIGSNAIVGDGSNVANNSIVIGVNTRSIGDNAISIGTNAIVDVGDSSIAICTGAYVIGSYAVVIGNATASNGDNSVTIGSTSNATGDCQISIGAAATTSGGNDSIAIGHNATATGGYCIAIGSGVITTSAVGEPNVSLGYNINNVANNGYGGQVIVGVNITSIQDYGVAFGHNLTMGNYYGNINFGSDNTMASGYTAGVLLIGRGNATLSSGDGNVFDGIGIGWATVISGLQSIAIGRAAQVLDGAGGIAIGDTAISHDGGLSIGLGVQTINGGLVAIGRTVVANGGNNVAVGYNVSNVTTGGGNVAFGKDISITTPFSYGSQVMLGMGITVTGDASVGVGVDLAMGGSYGNVALGMNSVISGYAGLSLGWRADVGGSASISIGWYTSTGANDYAVGLGYQTTVSGIDGVAIGHGAVAGASEVVFGGIGGGVPGTGLTTMKMVSSYSGNPDLFNFSVNNLTGNSTTSISLLIQDDVGNVTVKPVVISAPDGFGMCTLQVQTP